MSQHWSPNGVPRYTKIITNEALGSIVLFKVARLCSITLAQMTMVPKWLRAPSGTDFGELWQGFLNHFRLIFNLRYSKAGPITFRNQFVTFVCMLVRWCTAVPSYLSCGSSNL